MLPIFSVFQVIKPWLSFMQQQAWYAEYKCADIDIVTHTCRYMYMYMWCIKSNVFVGILQGQNRCLYHDGSGRFHQHVHFIDTKSMQKRPFHWQSISSTRPFHRQHPVKFLGLCALYGTLTWCFLNVCPNTCVTGGPKQPFATVHSHVGSRAYRGWQGSVERNVGLWNAKGVSLNPTTDAMECTPRYRSAEAFHDICSRV